jgi:phytanoyl-CoA hydroxylase
MQAGSALRFLGSDDGLTPDMRAAFAEEGYLLIEDFVSPALCDRLIERANALVDGFDASAHRTVFSTQSVAHAADRYFQESGDAIRFFLEEEAVDADGNLTRPKRLAVNKIGHALHDLDPVFSDFSRQPRLAALAKGLFQDPLLLQSMYIFKQLGIGGEVSWHQDSTYLYTEPHELHRLLVRTRGRRQQQWRHAGYAGCPSGSLAQAVPARWRCAYHRNAR